MMKLSLSISVLFAFTIFHFSKAGPLRIQKRAAFYIANETACVVDNIVYSNGEPIPTDDPCESCKCRPPGFACVLQDCKVKPGCKAVRRVGQCCPEYICDIPEGNNFFGGNLLPSANLLPTLNDESVLPGELPSSQTPEPSERPADSTQPPSSTPLNSNKEIATTESRESVAITDKPQATEPAILATEDSKSDSSTEERNGEEEKPSSEEEKLSIEEEKPSIEEENQSSEEKKEDVAEDKVEEGKASEVIEEIKTLFNSDTEIKKEDSAESTEVKIDPTQSSAVESEDQKLQTDANVVSEVVSEPEVTEKSRDESISTQTPDTEKQVKNSAAENSKSLKLSDGQTEDPEKKEEIQVDEPEKTEETLKTETVTSSELPLVAEESSTAESELESRENVPEETQVDPKISSVNSNEKIKSESAETVTIVVNVRDKTEPTTEEDVGIVSVTEKNLLESSELEASESSEESAEAEAESTDKNFEIFSSSTDGSKDKSATNSPSTEQELGVVDKIESTTLAAIKENVTEAKNDDSLIAITTQSAKEDTDASKGARANEEAIDEPKSDEPTITVIRINPNAPIRIEIITDTTATTKSEEQPTKDIGNTETTEGTKAEDNPKIKDETKQEEKVTEAISEAREEPEKETVTEKLDETKAELSGKVEESPSTEKVEESPSTEKVEESPSTEKVEESPSTEKVEESPSTEKVESPSTEKVESPSTEKVEESTSTEKVKESTSTEKCVTAEERAEEPEVLESTTEKVEIVGTEKSKVEASTSVTDQVTEESKQTAASSDSE